MRLRLLALCLAGCGSGSASVVIEDLDDPSGRIEAEWEAASAVWFPPDAQFEAYGLDMASGTLGPIGFGATRVPLLVSSRNGACQQERRLGRGAQELIDAADGREDVAEFCDAVTQYMGVLQRVEGAEARRSLSVFTPAFDFDQDGTFVALGAGYWQARPFPVWESWDPDACAFGEAPAQPETVFMELEEGSIDLVRGPRFARGTGTAKLTGDVSGTLSFEFDAAWCDIDDGPVVLVRPPIQ